MRDPVVTGDVAHRGAQLVGAGIHPGHPVPRGGERLRAGQADAAGGAGDQDVAAHQTNSLSLVSGMRA